MSQEVKKVHFVGVGGVGMGSLAGALSSAGFEVTGSDGVLYHPMKGVLESANVRLLEGFKEEHLRCVDPDIVIIGNVVGRDNEEAAAWIRSHRTYISFPEAVRRFLIGEKRSIVCAGTHGKTTTTSWLAYLLSSLNFNPSYLVGGVPCDLPQGSVLASGDLFVGEGDEYDSAFFDKGPKFLHYNPNFAILSSIEFDHADIYRDIDHVKAAFRKLIAILPGDGLCVARFEDRNVMESVPNALCPVQTFGNSAGAMWRLGSHEHSPEGTNFELLYKRKSAGIFKTPMLGEYNLLNLISGIVCAVNLGISMEKIRPLVATFRGVRRRQEILLQKPIVLVDDFAHHPTEVCATLNAVRERFPQGKLWALFEPRSATARRNVHQEGYVKSFDSADHVLVTDPYRGEEIEESNRFSAKTLIDALKEGGKQAASFPSAKLLLEAFLQQYQEGDTVVVMSNGEFDKIQEEIVTRLR